MQVQFVGWDSLDIYEKGKMVKYNQPYFHLVGPLHSRLRHATWGELRLGLGWFSTLGIHLVRGRHYPPRKYWIRGSVCAPVTVTDKITISTDEVIKLLQATYGDLNNLTVLELLADLQENMR